MTTKLCLLINTLAGGGAERVALSLKDVYKKHGLTVTFVCLNKNNFYQINSPVKYLSEKNSEHDTFIQKFFSLFSYAIKLKKIVARENISIVQSHLYRANYVNILARCIGSKHLAQLVSHGIASRYAHAGLTGKINLAMIKRLYPIADQLIFPSQGMRNDLSKLLPFAHENMFVINNPLEVKMIQQQSDKPVESEVFFFEDHKRYAVAAGRLEKVKRFQDIIYAIYYLRIAGKNLELVILGDGPERASLELLVDQLALKNRVHFLGLVDNPYQYMARADIFLSASENESFSNVISEALACKTAIVSTDCISGPREILAPDTDTNVKLQKGEIEFARFGVLVPVQDSETMAIAVQALIEDTNRLEHYAKKGLQRAQMFRTDIVGHQYIQAVQELLG